MGKKERKKERKNTKFTEILIENVLMAFSWKVTI